MIPNLIDYVIARKAQLPPLHAGLYEYALAGNGLFIRSERKGLEALIPVAEFGVQGLVAIKPYVTFTLPHVPVALTRTLLLAARQERNAEGQLLEAMYHLTWDEANSCWQTDKPAQKQSSVTIQPIGPFAGTSYETHLIEVHSHHILPCHDFSTVDDESEAGMFRLFGLLVDIVNRPRLRLRVSVFGHHWDVPASLVFELPPEMEHDDVSQAQT